MSSGALSRILRRPATVFAVVWLGLFLASVAWVFATPLSGSPDEPAHIVKAASVVRGQFLGDPTDAGAVRVVEVPDSIARSKTWPCFAFQTNVSANCIGEIWGGPQTVETTTSAGLYNPTYYMLVGWPSLLAPGSGGISVYGMRLVSALVVTFFLAAGFMALSRLRPNGLTALGFAAAITPMVLFLTSAVNPNALEVATGFALLCALFVLLSEEPPERRWPWLTLIATSGVVLAQARGLSPLWMILIAAIVIVATPWHRVVREFSRAAVIVTVGVLVLGAGAGLAWTLSTGTLGSLGNYPGAEDTPTRAFVNVLTDYTFNAGIIGYFGWLDTPAPDFVYALWSFLAFATVLIGLAVARGRGLAALVVALGGVLLVPAVVQAGSVTASGYIWQGRYALVAYVCAMATAVIVAPWPSSPTLPATWLSRSTVFVVSAVVVGHVWSLIEALRRYQAGDSFIDLFLRPVWIPPGGVVGLVVLEIIAVMITSGAVLVATTRRARTELPI